MKRIILCVVLVMSMLLSACGTKEKNSDNTGNVDTSKANESSETGVELRTSGPIVDEKMNFTLVGRQEPLAPEWNEMELFQNLEADTNIHIDWNLVPTSDWDTKRELLLAGDLPDGFFAAAYQDNTLINSANDGVFIPLDDLIEKYAPNIKKMFERAPYLKALVTHEDGHIYSLPAAEELALGHARNFVSVNKEWLDNLGLEMPNTPEEFKEVLIAFRDNDANGNGDPNDEIPFAFLNMFWCSDIGDLMAAFGAADNAEHVVVTDDQKLKYTANTPEYRKALEYFADLYKEGLIDPESFTAYNEFQLLFAKGQSHTLGSYIWWETAEIAGEYKDEYQLMLPWMNEDGIRVTGRSNDKDGGKSAFMITSACENPEVLIQWVDRLYEPYMAAQVHWGPPGEDNLLIDDNGYLKYNDKLTAEAGERRQQIAPNGVGVILKEDFGTVVDAEPRAMQRLNEIQTNYEPYMPKYNFPKAHIPFTTEEQEIIGELELPINDYIREMRANFIVNGITDSSWDKYISELDAYGLPDLMEQYENGYARYLELFK